MLYAERHRPRGVGLAGAMHRTWAVAEKNDWQFSNPRIDTVSSLDLVWNTCLLYKLGSWRPYCCNGVTRMLHYVEKSN